MKQRISRIEPVQLGKIFAVTYAVFSIIFVPFIAIAMLMDSDESGSGVLIIVGVTIGYMVLGFIGGVIGAFIYNLAAKWIGGIEIEIETVS